MRVYSTDNGWGLFKDESGEARSQARKYRRTYTWNSRNQLVSSVDANYSTSYVYGQDGQRSNKYTQGSETLYFNKMWTLHTDNGNSVYGGQYAKNVYLGETRIVTKLARADQKTAHEETYKQYYYHSDHLGSATMISDWEGKEYQRIEYTPYGETWVEKTNNSGSEFLPYRFTGKEVDQETGLYYYGARYLDPKYSMWISTDPALGEYIPEMGKGNSKNSANLPGMGGVYNHINFHLYHYAGNNPVRFVDPDGRKAGMSDEYFRISSVNASNHFNGTPPEIKSLLQTLHNRRTRITQNDIKFPDPSGPCLFRAIQAIAEEKTGQNLTFEQITASYKDLVESGAMDENYYIYDIKAVLEDAFIRLGWNNVIVTVSDYIAESSNCKPDFTIRNVLLGTHFQTGNSNGEYLWEPFKYSYEANIDKSTAVRIREIKIWFDGVSVQ